MLSGARRSSEGKECFFGVISNLSVRQRGGDTGPTPRELRVRWTGSGQMRWIKAIWLDWMTSSCFLHLHPSSLLCFLHLGLNMSFCFTCSTLFLCSQCLDSFVLNCSRTPWGIYQCEHTAPSWSHLSNQRNRKLPWKLKQTNRTMCDPVIWTTFTISRVSRVTSNFLCLIQSEPMT